MDIASFFWGGLVFLYIGFCIGWCLYRHLDEKEKKKSSSTD